MEKAEKAWNHWVVDSEYTLALEAVRLVLGDASGLGSWFHVEYLQSMQTQRMSKFGKTITRAAE